MILNDSLVFQKKQKQKQKKKMSLPLLSIGCNIKRT